MVCRKCGYSRKVKYADRKMAGLSCPLCGGGFHRRIHADDFSPSVACECGFRIKLTDYEDHMTLNGKCEFDEFIMTQGIKEILRRL